MEVFNEQPSQEDFKFALIKDNQVEAIFETLELAQSFATSGSLIMRFAGLVEVKSVDCLVTKHFPVYKRKVTLSVKSEEK